jgi:hypothetical protein
LIAQIDPAPECPACLRKLQKFQDYQEGRIDTEGISESGDLDLPSAIRNPRDLLDPESGPEDDIAVALHDPLRINRRQTNPNKKTSLFNVDDVL